MSVRPYNPNITFYIEATFNSPESLENAKAVLSGKGYPSYNVNDNVLGLAGYKKAQNVFGVYGTLSNLAVPGGMDIKWNHKFHGK